MLTLLPGYHVAKLLDLDLIGGAEVQAAGVAIERAENHAPARCCGLPLIMTR